MTLGSMFDISKGSAFENPGLLGTSPRQVMSLVGNNSGSANIDLGLSSGSYFYNPEMLGCLRDWELTEAILEIYDSLVSDILSSSEPQVTTGNTVVDKDLAEYISKIGLTQNILDHLKDDIYYGQRSFVVDIQGKGIIPIANERNFILIEHLGKPYKYQFVSDEVNSSVIDYNKLTCICFNKKQVASKKSSKIKLVNNPELNSILNDLTYYSGQSVLKSSLYLLFIHFLKSLLSTLLTMRNLTRPDLIKANIQPGANNEQSIVEAINNIEALLNQGDYSFDFRTTDPFAIISTIYNSIANSVKVVPGLSNYTEFDMIQQPDISAKIESLNNDINNLKVNIINNEGIPDELMGGSANRWEVMSRSSRLFSKIKGIINDISWTYKDIAKKYVKYKYDKDVVINQFKFNLDSNNYLYASSLNQKIQLLSDNFDKINGLSKSLMEMRNSKLFNQKKALEYIVNALKSTDTSLAEIINLDYKGEDTPSSSESDSENSNSGW